MAGLSLSTVDGAGNTVKKITFNRTFFVANHTSAYALGPVKIPRADGDRLPDTAYLVGKPITVQGWVASGTATGEVGTANRRSSGGSVMGHVPGSTTPPNFLLELRTFLGRLHARQTMILDYGNGWFQYVRVEDIQDAQEEGFPDLRHFAITFYAADPLAYTSTLVSLDSSTLGASANIIPNVGGKAPSSNWVLQIYSRGVAQLCRVQTDDHVSFTVSLPVAPGGVVVNGYTKSIKSVASVDLQLNSGPRWDLWQSGSQFFLLKPDNDITNITFIDPTQPGSSVGLVFNSDIDVKFDARGADWMADSLRVPAIPSVGEYGTGQYGVSQYG